MSCMPVTALPFQSAHMTGEPAQPWTLSLASALHTEQLGSTIGRRLRQGEVIALMGEMGSGKTTFVRGLARGAGLSAHVVSSPTFVVIQEYIGPIALAHVDLYRLEDPRDVDETGLSDYLTGPFAVLIEWADRLPAAWWPDNYLLIHFTHAGRTSRRASVQAFGPQGHRLLRTIMADSGKPSS